MQPTKPIFMLLSLVLAASLLLSACSSDGTTETSDPCAPENLPDQVEVLSRLMSAFDDTAQLAASTPREQLGGPIAALQAVRRQVEYLQVPVCLETLKSYQLAHMNTVLNTLLAFLSGVQPEVLSAGIAQARAQRAAYDAEWARLMGVTLTPVPTFIIPTAATTPTP